MRNSVSRQDLALLLIFVVLGFLTRTVFHIGANIEFVTALSLTAGFFFKNKQIALFVPVLILGLSDLVLGNTNIMLFTWSAYLLAPAAGIVLRKLNFTDGKLFLATIFAGLAFTVWFYLWTNFGVVVVSNMYPKDLSGLTQSYINALPFLRPQLLGNLLIVPAVFALTALMLKHSAKLKLHL